MAVRAVLELDHTTESISEVFDITPRCVRQWVAWFNRDGSEGLRDMPKSGRPRAVPASRCTFHTQAATRRSPCMVPWQMTARRCFGCMRFDAATFVSYLDRLRRMYSKILGMVDSASPYRSRAVADYLARHHATVALLRFPVGLQHPNAAEATWRRAKLEIQAGECHGPFENLKKKLSEYFRTTRFKLDLYKCLQKWLVVGNHFGA